MIAMALACDPDILIADEPTTALDVTIQAQIIELMKEMQQTNGNAIILITHDLGVVADVADKIMVMYAGHPVEFGTAEEIFYEPVHPYTWGLVRSIPKPAGDEKTALTPIEGNPPSLVNLPERMSLLAALPVRHRPMQDRDARAPRHRDRPLLPLPLLGRRRVCREERAQDLAF